MLSIHLYVYGNYYLKILGIDTSTRQESAAVIEEDRILSQRRNSEPSLSSRKILLFVDTVLKEASLTIREIDAVAVTIGPGSFTGLRIGLAICKGISMAVGKPVIPVSTLDSLVKSHAITGRVVPLLDARQSQVYAAVYISNPDGFTKIEEEMAIGLEPLCRKIKEKTVFCGEGAGRYEKQIRSILGELAVIPTQNPVLTVAAGAALLGITLLKQGKLKDSAAITPTYIRRSEAEMTLNVT